MKNGFFFKKLSASFSPSPPEMAIKLDRTLIKKIGEFRQNLSPRLLKINVRIILALADSFLEKILTVVEILQVFYFIKH